MKVLLVEDSRSVSVYIQAILRRAPDIELLPTVRDGASAVESAVALAPDVILMDLELPVLDGISAITQIMERSPRPIVVLSAHLDKHDGDRTFDAFRAGAVEVLKKPEGLGRDAEARFEERLVWTLRVMREAKVLRRFRSQPYPLSQAEQGRGATGESSHPGTTLLLIGGSTGAPLVIYELLELLPKPFPIPIVVCQHIIAGFEEGLAEWLSRTGHRAGVAKEGEMLASGSVFVAPADRPLTLGSSGLELHRPLGGETCPSIDRLFQSAAVSYGKRCTALLLSGMGSDGARGLLALRERGALTVTQKKESCVVASMPDAARELGASEKDLSPREMGELLKSLSSKQS